MNALIPVLHKCIYVRPNHSWSSFIYRRSEYKGFYESLQIAFPNNVLVSQFRSMLHRYIYIPRCLIIDRFYGPRYVSNPPFLERSANLWAHWLCASTTASYSLYIFEYSLIIMVNARWLTRQRIWSGRIGNLHISMVCSSLHGREGRSQQSSSI